MPLLDRFYRLTELTRMPGIPGEEYTARVVLDKDDPVYGGHFPGNPVVPGVCQVEIIRELVALIEKRDVSLISSDTIKFLNMINPSETPELQVRIGMKRKEKDLVDVSGTISGGEKTFLKFRGSFR